MFLGKIIFALSIGFVSTASFAANQSSIPGTGYGDEIYCFQPKVKKFDEGLPSKICLSSLEVLRSPDSQDVLSVTGPNLSLKSNYVTWADYDSMIMMATFEKFITKYSNCFDNLEADLVVKYKQSAAGEVGDWNDVSLTLKYQATRDNCHFDWHQDQVEYVPMF